MYWSRQCFEFVSLVCSDPWGPKDHNVQLWSQRPIHLVPCTQRFLQILWIFWWYYVFKMRRYSKSMQFPLSNIIQNCSTICRQFFTDWWTTEHLYFWETLPLYLSKILFLCYFTLYWSISCYGQLTLVAKFSNCSFLVNLYKITVKLFKLCYFAIMVYYVTETALTHSYSNNS